MQAELNKYFYNDITNIILSYHYKTQFYEVMEEMTGFIKKHTWLLEDDDDEDSEDDNDQFYEINRFRNKCLKNYKSRIRKMERQNRMTEEDTDSDTEEEYPYKIFRSKNYHYYCNHRHYSPEEFAYNLRYQDADDEDEDF